MSKKKAVSNFSESISTLSMLELERFVDVDDLIETRTDGDGNQYALLDILNNTE